MNMRQIFLVLKREYLTKIKTKAFIIATILIPLGMVTLIGFGVGMALWDTDPELTIGIADQTGEIYPRLEKIDNQRYMNVADLPEDSVRAMVIQGTLTGYISLRNKNIDSGANPELVYGGSGGIALLNGVRNDLRDAIREVRLRKANVSEEIQNIYESRVGLDSRKLTKEGEEKEDNTGFLSGLGMLMGIVIFASLFGYGGLLTRSIIEEKTNRIIEVIASSVKPIELLIGKMAGVGALALTQIGFWIVAFFGISAAAAPVAGLIMEAQTKNLPGEAASSFDPSTLQLPDIDPMIFVYFIVFFLLGYLLYSSFFAAIGSAVDSETDTQQFMFPIMIPIMIAYFIMFRAIESPDGSLAVVGSLIPFFAPIVMITRIAITEVPFWQISVSIVLIIITFIVAMWLSAKIYSVGILSYGKSANYKELLKWIRQG